MKASGSRQKQRMERYHKAYAKEDLHNNVFGKVRQEVAYENGLYKLTNKQLEECYRVENPGQDPLEYFTESQDPRLQDQYLRDHFTSQNMQENDYFSELYDMCWEDERNEAEYYSRMQ